MRRLVCRRHTEAAAIPTAAHAYCWRMAVKLFGGIAILLAGLLAWPTIVGISVSGPVEFFGVRMDQWWPVAATALVVALVLEFAAVLRREVP